MAPVTEQAATSPSDRTLWIKMLTPLAIIRHESQDPNTGGYSANSTVTGNGKEAHVKV